MVQLTSKYWLVKYENIEHWMLILDSYSFFSEFSLMLHWLIREIQWEVFQPCVVTCADWNQDVVINKLMKHIAKMLTVLTGICVEILSFTFYCFLGKDLSRLKTQFQPFVKLPEDKQRALYKTLCELLLREEMVTALEDVVRWRNFGLLPKSNFRIQLALSFAWTFLFSRSFTYLLLPVRCYLHRRQARSEGVKTCTTRRPRWLLAALRLQFTEWAVAEISASGWRTLLSCSPAHQCYLRYVVNEEKSLFLFYFPFRSSLCIKVFMERLVSWVNIICSGPFYGFCVPCLAFLAVN